MTTTIGSLDLNAFSDLYSDSNQYFWFEPNSSATYGAGAHVTLVPDTTFISNPTGQNVLINTDGISIRNGLLPMMTLDNNSLDFNMIDTVGNTYTNAASFGISSTIGLTDGTQSYLYEDYHSLQMIDKEGDVYFHVSDLRDKYGCLTETFEGDGETTSFKVAILPDPFGRTVVTVDGVETTDYTINLESIVFNSAPSNGASISISYTPSVTETKAYTFGKRGEGDVGFMSLAEGEGNISSGTASHAEGLNTQALVMGSHSEGFETQAIGGYSHAEGLRTKAGMSSHSEGSGTNAMGVSAHAQNTGTIAQRLSQTAIGEYNIADTVGNNYLFRGLYAFIIGNGTADNARSNALTVDWNGNVIASGDVTDGSGNVLSDKANTSDVPTKTSDLTNDSNFVSFETGTATAGSVTWEYRKWADGTLEMWGSGLTTLNINTAVGNIYTTAGEYDIVVPSFVDSVDFVTGELSGGGWVDVTGFNVPPKIRLYAPTAYTSTNRYLRYYLKGTWS